MRRVLAVLALCLLQSSPAQAVPVFRDLAILGDSETFLRVAPGGLPGTVTLTNGPAADNAGQIAELQGTRVQGDAEAETAGGFAPFAFASASLSVIEFGRARPFTAEARATFTYQIEIVLAGDQTPDSVLSIPTDVIGSVSVNDGPGSFASASTSIDTLDGFNVARFDTDAGDSDFAETIGLVRNRIYVVELSAFATAQVGIFEQSAGASAFADPTLLFNQARFDELQAEAGFATFDLEQYYEIGISAMVIPEPGAAPLVSSALLVLVALRRRGCA